jgi:hypothetical protein
MISDEEYNYIFDQLTQMLSLNGREDIVVAVQSQITNLDAVPGSKLIEAENHFLHSVKELSSLEQVEREVLSSYIYPPRERVEMMLRAVEAAYPVPIFVGLSALDSLHLKELRLEGPSQADVSFTLTRSELEEQKQHAQKLLHDIEQLRGYIN